MNPDETKELVERLKASGAITMKPTVHEPIEITPKPAADMLSEEDRAALSRIADVYDSLAKEFSSAHWYAAASKSKQRADGLRDIKRHFDEKDLLRKLFES